MSSSFSARSAESLDSTPPQSASRNSRHRSNLSVNPAAKSTTTSVTIPSTLDFDKSSTNTYSTEHHHNNHKENSSSVSTDIAHNNNKTIKDNDVGELEKELPRRSLKGISPTPQQNHPMSPVQNTLDHTQHEPELKVSEASRTSEMPDLSEQPSTFTRSAASTATLMAESTKERTPPSHNASLKIDDPVRKMLPLKQRLALSEDGSLDEKVNLISFFDHRNSRYLQIYISFRIMFSVYQCKTFWFQYCIHLQKLLYNIYNIIKQVSYQSVINFAALIFFW